MTEQKLLDICHAAGIRPPDYKRSGLPLTAMWDGPRFTLTLTEHNCIGCSRWVWNAKVHERGRWLIGGSNTIPFGDTERLRKLVEWVDRQPPKDEP